MRRALDRSAPRGRRLRPGKSLIEMMVVVAWTSALVGIAGQALHRLALVERAGRDAAVIGRSEFRLARDLRADARAAAAAELLHDAAGGPTGLRLATADGTVEYAAAADGVRRTAAGGRFEAYRLGPTAVAFAVESGRFVTVFVRPRRTDRSDARIAAGPLRVVAAVGPAARRPSGPSVRPPVKAPRPASEELP